MVWQYPELGWPELRVHPQYLIDDEDRAVLEIWRRSRGGMGGTAHLPEAGGVMDQAAATLASTLQLSSRPKKATAPWLHCSVTNLVPTKVSA